MNIQDGDLLLDIFVVALGALAIINGRRFYWAFVGIGGAVVGLWLSAWMFPELSDWIHIAVTLVAALLAVWFSFRFEKLALHFAAFVLGGFILEFLMLDANFIELRRVADFGTVLIGGLIGLGFEYYYSNRSLIVFSSFTGAALIAAVANVSPAFDAALFSGLAAVGMLLQAREWIYVEDDAPVNGAKDLA